MTNDVLKLVEFYEFVLQCDAEGDETHTSFDEAQLAIWNPGSISISEQKNMSLMYFVDDADVEYERLKESKLNIKFQSQPKEEPWGVKAFVFFDPDENEINFIAPIK